MSKCDICGFEARLEDGYVLTSGEVVVSGGYWRHQLPKYRQLLEMINESEAKVQFLVERVAEAAGSKTGWLVCPGCRPLFTFDEKIARAHAARGEDRPTVGDLTEATLTRAVEAARPAMEEVLAAVMVPEAPLSVPTRKYWQCIKCGAVSAKEEDLRSTTEPILQAGGSVAGGITCADCRTRYDLSDVMRGKYDMREPDKTLDAMVSNAGNASMDPLSKVWSYNGREIQGPVLMDQSRGRQRKWWQFWRS